jgi:anti-sigma factor RsiW
MAAKKQEELFDLIPAYAIGALDEDERAELEAWLQSDPAALAS